MTLETAKSYKGDLTKMNTPVLQLEESKLLFTRIDPYLLIRPEIFVGIACHQPGQPCGKDRNGPFYDCAHVVLRDVRVRSSPATIANRLHFLPSGKNEAVFT